jgi:hypothetical protein
VNGAGLYLSESEGLKKQKAPHQAIQCGALPKRQVGEDPANTTQGLRIRGGKWPATLGMEPECLSFPRQEKALAHGSEGFYFVGLLPPKPQPVHVMPMAFVLGREW